MDRCLEVSNVYGDEAVIRLVFDRTKCRIDLHPFFDAYFSYRDDDFGSPKYKRFVEQGRNDPDLRSVRGGGFTEIEYRFTFIEFLESFANAYEPDELADFLEAQMEEDSIQAESFVQRVRTSKEFYKFAMINRWSPALKLRPLDFPIETIDSRIPKSIRSRSQNILAKETTTEYGGVTYPLSVPVAPTKFPRLREILLQEEPPIVILSRRHPVDLTYWDLLWHFDLEYKHLDLILRETAQNQ